MTFGRYIRQAQQDVIASCAAGPWQDGPPPKDKNWSDPFGLWWNGCNVDFIRWLECDQSFVDVRGRQIREDEIVKHAPINLPEE
jgi:hypothetical protein